MLTNHFNMGRVVLIAMSIFLGPNMVFAQDQAVPVSVGDSGGPLAMVDLDQDGIPSGCDSDDNDETVIDPMNGEEGCDIETDDSGNLYAGDGYADRSCNGIPDEAPDTVCDNCRSVYNPDQADSDEDGVGDACERDESKFQNRPTDSKHDSDDGKSKDRPTKTSDGAEVKSQVTLESKVTSAVPAAVPSSK